MKSTYQILSKSLDGLPLAKNIPIKVWTTNEQYLAHIATEKDLFDYPHCRRVIQASDLISSDIDNLSICITQLDNLEELITKIDFISSLPVNNVLFLKRVNQTLALLISRHPDITFTIMVEKKKIDKIKKIAKQIQ